MSEVKAARKKRRRSGRATKPTQWQRSPQWREIGRAAITKFNALRPQLPKCGAFARSTGEPCRQLALENGRCRWHGGRTPSGDQHGIRQLTRKPRSRQTKGDWPRTQAKLDRLSREDTDRARRLYLMTDEQFAAYCRHTASRRDRQFRKIVEKEARRRGITKAQMTGSSEQPLSLEKTRPDTPEVAALKRSIESLEKELATMESDDLMTGVFA